MPLAHCRTFDRPLGAVYTRARRFTIPSGVAGTRATLLHIEREVQKGKRSPEVAELAEYILARFGARQHDQRSQITAIHRGMKAGLFYVFDPKGIETLRDGRILARKMLQHFRGEGPRPLADCDDYTIVGRELAEFIGMDSKSRAVGTKKPGRYNHVYPMVKPRRGPWIGMEATVPGARPPWVPVSRTIRPMDIPGRGAEGLGQGSFIETAAANVLRQVLPETLERTMAPVVAQLKEELKFLRYLLIALAALAAAGAYFLIWRAPRIRRTSK